MNMKWKILGAMFAVLALMTSGASADYLAGTNGYGFQAYQIPNQDNHPYWDGNSSDSLWFPATIGNFLTGTGYFTGNPNSPKLTNPQWWGASNGSADPNMYFVQTSTSTQVQLLVEVADLEDYNYFGWYYVSGGTVTMTQIFSGTDTESASALLSITLPTGITTYGFYLGVDANEDGTIDNYYYMESYLNSGSEKNKQHFAIFYDADMYPDSYFIGIEDLPLYSSDKDYNDMVVRVTSINVPIPGSMLLLGTGLFGLALLARRRQGRRS